MRYPPISESQWTAAQRGVAKAIVEGPRGEVRGPFVPLLYAPELADKVQALGALIRFGTGIPNGLLEIAVCMTARARDCAYIWAAHSRHAIKDGIARDLLAAIARRERPAVMSDDEALVWTFCSELLGASKVSDATFAAAVARWDRKGVMEITGTCGYYGMLAGVLNVSEHPMAPGTVPFGT